MAEQFLYDFLDAFIGGVNSDLPPIKLPKDVCAWTTNCTLRGGYPKPRPPRFRKTLTFPNTDVENAVLTGFFQGGGWYRPDFGQSQLIAAISGRLYSFTEIGAGWTVADITVPGDPNLSTTNQVWMNQAEKWLIVTDGSDQLPIFYDGATSRRSYGASVVLATTTAGWVVPDVGTSVTVTLTANYDGPYGIPVITNGEFYQLNPTTGGGGGNPILKNLTGTPGANIPTGSDIVVRSGIAGVLAANSTTVVSGSGRFRHTATLHLTGVFSHPNGTSIILQGLYYTGNTIPVQFSVTSGSGTNTIVVARFPDLSSSQPIQFLAGTFVTLASAPPDVVVATTTADATTPPVDGTTEAAVTPSYTGPADQLVWIGSAQFTITAGSGPGASNQVSLLNLTDTGSDPVAGQDILSVPELPAGRMGAYGLGHQAMSLVDGLSYIYGDTVGGPSGTPANNYRDAVLKTTENTFLEGGGSFRVPSAGEAITSMTFTAILDAAYGQGPLEIGTASGIFTCAVPSDRATWIALENPILTQALIGEGPLAQDSTVLANSDTFFRSTEGLGSLIFGRRNFETWGNTPISTEMNRIVELDDRSLLNWSSAVTFDNRLLHTATPSTVSQGTSHAALMALNFDPVSSLRGKAPSIWESVWDGLNVLRVITGQFNGTKRCFMFVTNASGQLELWEQLRSDSPQFYDNGTDRITYTVETPCIFKPEERSDKMPMVRLVNGKIHVDKLRGNVEITVQFRPDYSTTWQDWITLNISDTTAPGYLTPLGLGEPPVTPCNAPNNRVLRSGRFFQIRFIVTGQCVLMGSEFAAVPEQTVVFPPPNCGTIPS